MKNCYKMKENYFALRQLLSPLCLFNFSQQAGGAIVMDADATSALHKRGVSATDDSYKFVWFQVIYNSYQISLLHYIVIMSLM